MPRDPPPRSGGRSCPVFKVLAGCAGGYLHGGKTPVKLGRGTCPGNPPYTKMPVSVPGDPALRRRALCTCMQRVVHPNIALANDSRRRHSFPYISCLSSLSSLSDCVVVISCVPVQRAVTQLSNDFIGSLPITVENMLPTNCGLVSGKIRTVCVWVQHCHSPEHMSATQP